MLNLKRHVCQKINILALHHYLAEENHSSLWQCTLLFKCYKTHCTRFQLNRNGLGNVMFMYSRAPVTADSVRVVSVICSLLRPPKKLENQINKQFISFKLCTKRERAVKWWNQAAQMHPVLDSSSFVPVPTLKCQNTILAYERERESTLYSILYYYFI
jgi:hypothetical protein